MKNNKPVIIDTNAPTPGLFSDGTIALLGVDAIYTLGINLQYAIKNIQHKDVKFIPNQNHLLINAKKKAVKMFTESEQLHKILHKKTNLSERVLKQYLEKHPDDYTRKSLDPYTIDIAPNIQKEDKDNLLSLIDQYADVFAGHTNVLPPAMKGVEPHMFKLKPGAQPVYETRPTFSPSTAKVINE